MKWLLFPILVGPVVIGLFQRSSPVAAVMVLIGAASGAVSQIQKENEVMLPARQRRAMREDCRSKGL